MPSVALACLLGAFVLPREAAAQSCELPFQDFDLVLEGRVGAREVRARLGPGGEDDPSDERAVSGEFDYSTRWKTGPAEFTVDGVLADDCSIRLSELDASRMKTAAWALRFFGNRFEGTRTDAASGSTARVVLQEAPDVDCGGGGTWRTFRSERWPITLSYPANWQLTEDADRLELLCPNPERLVYGGRPITLERGVGFDSIEGENG